MTLKAGFATLSAFPLADFLRFEKQKNIISIITIITIFPSFSSQKRNILLRRKQLLKKSIQQHRIYKRYKSKSKEKPTAYVKGLQFCIEIGHIQWKDRDHRNGDRCGEVHKCQQKCISAKCPQCIGKGCDHWEYV